MTDQKTISPLAQMFAEIKPVAKKNTTSKKSTTTKRKHTRKTSAQTATVSEQEETKKIYVKVKYKQKNQFKVFFPEALWQKGKGWAIDDTVSNQDKLDEWYKKSEELESQELQQALSQITEGLATIVKKIEELDVLINQKKGNE